MSGFRKAMPFTFGAFVVGGLALAGVPPFSGFFSKDEILAYTAAREDWHIVLTVVGYIAALLTAIYTFRLIFRAFWGDPSPEARELEHGHLFHAEEHSNPATGEVEDTDVGFPGPEHHIAEREGTMKIAMGTLAVLAIGAGVLQIPKVTEVLHPFLEPTFARSELFETLEPSSTLTVVGLLIGAGLGIAGIAVAYLLWVKNPTRPAAYRERLGAVHGFLTKKWYFDELIDWLVVRPFGWFGRFARNTFERLVINGVFVGGTTGAIRAGSAAVRAAQSGYLRYYVTLLLAGVVALALYFLLAA